MVLSIESLIAHYPVHWAISRTTFAGADVQPVNAYRSSSQIFAGSEQSDSARLALLDPTRFPAYAICVVLCVALANSSGWLLSVSRSSSSARNSTSVRILARATPAPTFVRFALPLATQSFLRL